MSLPSEKNYKTAFDLIREQQKEIEELKDLVLKLTQSYCVLVPLLYSQRAITESQSMELLDMLTGKTK